MLLSTEKILVTIELKGEQVYPKVIGQQNDLEASTKKADKGLKGLSTTFTELSSIVNLAGIALKAAQSTISAMKAPVDLAVNFEKEFATIKTLSADVGDELEKGLLDLAERLPQTAGDITKSAYQAISAGISVEDTVASLDAASKLAVAGNASLEDSVTLLATVTNAYKDSGLDAARASDILFATVKGGITDISSLSSALGSATATASTYGVSMEEVTGALATLTKKFGAGSTSASITRINALIKAIVKPSKAATRVMDKLGIAYGVSALKAKGLTGVLSEITEKTGGSTEALGSLLGRFEATQALLVLTKNGMADYKQGLDGVTESAGAVTDAFEIMQGTTQGQIDLFNSQLEGVLREAGTQLLPLVNDGLREISEVMKASGPEIVKAVKGMADELVGMGKWIIANRESIFGFFTGLADGTKAAFEIMGYMAEEWHSLFTSEVTLAFEAELDQMVQKAEWAQRNMEALAKQAGYASKKAKDEQDKARREGELITPFAGATGADTAITAAELVAMHGEELSRKIAKREQAALQAQIANRAKELEDARRAEADATEAAEHARQRLLSVASQKGQEERVGNLKAALAVKEQELTEVARATREADARLSQTRIGASQLVANVELEIERQMLAEREKMGDAARKARGKKDSEAAVSKRGSGKGRGAGRDLFLVEQADAKRAAALIENETERKLALLAVRHRRERRMAEKNGEDLLLLASVQSTQRTAIINSAADGIIEQQEAARKLEEEGNAAATAIAISLMDDEKERRLAELSARYEAERLLFADNLEYQAALQRKYEADSAAVVAEAAERKKMSWQEAGDIVLASTEKLGGALKKLGIRSQIAESLIMTARGIRAGADALKEGAESVAAYARYDILSGTAHAAAAIANGVAAAAYFKGAATTGGGGGGKTRPTGARASTGTRSSGGESYQRPGRNSLDGSDKQRPQTMVLRLDTPDDDSFFGSFFKSGNAYLVNDEAVRPSKNWSAQNA